MGLRGLDESASLEKNSVARKAMGDVLFNGVSVDDAMDEVKEKFEKSGVYLTSLEIDAAADAVKEGISFFAENAEKEMAAGASFLKPEAEFVDVFNETRKVRPDFLKLTADGITVGKWKTSKSKLAKVSGAFGKGLNTDLNLYELWLYGQKIGKRLFSDDFSVTATYAHLCEDPFDEGITGKASEAAGFDAAFANAWQQKLQMEARGECPEEECTFCPVKDACKSFSVAPPEIAMLPEEEFQIKSLDLSLDQQKFVDFDKGVGLVTARAGAGKTLTLTNWLIARQIAGAKPEEILCFSFTEAAAKTLKKRVSAYQKAFGLDMEGEINSTTFHGFSYQLIRREFQNLGFTAEPELLEESDRNAMILSSIDGIRLPGIKYGAFQAPFKPEKDKVFATFDMMAEMGITPGNYQDVKLPHTSPVPEITKEWVDAYQNFLIAKVKANKVDYSDMERLVSEILKMNPYYFREAGWNIRFVVIDECQDTTKLETEILEAIANSDNFEALVAMGDPAQYVYNFRHGSQRNMMEELMQKVGQEEPERFVFPENFRSSRAVVDASNKILERFFSERQSLMAPVRDVEGTVRGFVADNDAAKTRKIAELVAETIASGVAPGEILVEGRTGSQLLKIRNALTAAGIKSELITPIKICENSRVKGIAAAARFVNNPADTMSAFKFANTERDGTLIARTEEEIQAAVDELKRFVEDRDDEPKSEIFNELVKRLPADPVAKEFCRRISKRSSFAEKAEYIKNFMLLGGGETMKLPTSADSVKISTVHSCKGMEFQSVIVDFDKFENDEGTAELIFTAMTRAKDDLVLIGTEGKKSLVPKFENVLDMKFDIVEGETNKKDHNNDQETQKNS